MRDNARLGSSAAHYEARLREAEAQMAAAVEQVGVQAAGSVLGMDLSTVLLCCLLGSSWPCCSSSCVPAGDLRFCYVMLEAMTYRQCKLASPATAMLVFLTISAALPLLQARQHSSKLIQLEVVATLRKEGEERASAQLAGVTQELTQVGRGGDLWAGSSSTWLRAAPSYTAALFESLRCPRHACTAAHHRAIGAWQSSV
jgi:hypothetical protein